MGQKKVLESFPLITNGVMNGTATLLSPATSIKNLDNIGLQIDWTSTAVGTISVLCSIDGVTYHDLTFSPLLTQPAGTAGGYLISLGQLPYLWIKAKYINTSSTGVLNISICGKDIN
jgi:hypothetical protein